MKFRSLDIDSGDLNCNKFTIKQLEHMAFNQSVSSYSKISVKIYSLIFSKTFGRLKYFKNFSPDIEILGNAETKIKEQLNQYRKNNIGELSFLDIGARDATKSNLASGFNYQAIDIIPSSQEVLVGDICNCPQIPDNSYDVVFSMDVLEHVERPWDAAKECIRITKPGGLIIHRTLFSYRYHPIPKDYWRFTSQGLEYLFTHTGESKTLIKGYDIRGRRKNHIGYNMNSRPPIDWLGGFRENWQVLWVGEINK